MRKIRSFWPQHSLSDKLAFSFTHLGLIGIILFEFFIVLPIYHEPFTTMFCIQIAIGLYLAFQVFSNLYAMIFFNSSIKSQTNLPSVLYPDWVYCNFCQLNTPPRSHHCPVCNVCVLKRDHHCIFTGNCVGFYNHRYFIMMVFHLWLGCFYCLLYNIEYYIVMLGNIGFGMLLKLLFPLLAWTFGFLNSYQLFIAFIMGINCMAMLLFSTLVCFQIFFISSGQTQFECRKKINYYSLSLLKNWRVVLGNRWFLTWICPYITSKLPGDGTDFKKSSIEMSPVNSNVKYL
ncbi:probable palmitoyltransferase ZDHHC24 [Hydra vulgaris]|uniref:Palmitoyltransferase n=1 Tax=Hydra vulgaris TaxID=6087 RepID=A0ABM4BHF9_HYDVU